MTIVQELNRRRAATPRLHPLAHGPRDPWAERPAPSTPAPHIIAAVVGATGCGSIYDLDQLREAWLATTDPNERAAVAAAARVHLDREEDAA